jgi:formylglycine-generating enzyme required for sulfatase activity
MEGLSPAYRIKQSTDPDLWGTLKMSDGRDPIWDAVQIVEGSNGYRLPTGEQWEYACRAGTTTQYYTGDDITDDTGWYQNNSNFKVQEVGQKPANAWGLHDMHGNMLEWCFDMNSRYERVSRGGSYQDTANNLRSAVERFNKPGSSYAISGFRVIRPE